MSSVNYGSLFEEGNLKILTSLDNPAKMKMMITLSSAYSHRLIINALSEGDTLKQINP